ncbi:DUF5056 domain-containing protein [Bacteroides sp. 519]|uniref:DUF5056 domain-containing protein n=1 Tax=Bacteroides sp. 519 TaxID=2302937 RepID=UPI0013D1C7C0|nr:DUF5056 domain-containing protein [Bacteroides sp. 519]NDV58699.1 DUF5056 domain-containing protein [Bacteroides sp. 519]
MTEIDDKLLTQFFDEQKQNIADNGFSTRVMRGLPNRSSKLYSIIVSFVAVLSVILFFVFDGIHAILSTLREVFVTVVQNSAANIDLRTLAIAGAVLLFYGVRKIYTME